MSDLKRCPFCGKEIEPEPISYKDCANAMLKMWMDKVLTDKEYYHIMDKLNKHEKEKLLDAVKEFQL